MTLLVISPDYASHLLPLATLATAWRDAGDRVVVATGPATTALPAVLRDLFRKSGRPLERELELVPVDPMREHRFTDGTVLRLPSGSRAAQLAAVDEAFGPAQDAKGRCCLCPV